MSKDKIKGFLLGILVMTLILSMSVSAYAFVGTKTLSASYDNIKIFINEKLITPKDASGNTVDPFIYNGTTYLPVRAVSEALGQDVYWDGQTKSVYIGSSPNTPTTDQVLMDKNDVKITYKGTAISSSFLGGYDIKLQIENNTSTNYTVQVRNFSINGIMADTIFSCGVAAGKTAIDKITISESSMEDIGQSSISSFETYFIVYATDDWSTDFESSVVSVTL